jgi:hypothetical protein
MSTTDHLAQAKINIRGDAEDVQAAIANALIDIAESLRTIAEQGPGSAQ